jgi:hypothetical protein
VVNPNEWLIALERVLYISITHTAKTKSRNVPRNNDTKLFSKGYMCKEESSIAKGESTVGIAGVLEWTIGWEGRC